MDLYPSVAEKAAALFHGLCSNHAFIDGNKRTAFVSADALCRLNGAKIAATADEIVALAVETATRSLGVEDVARRFADVVVER